MPRLLPIVLVVAAPLLVAAALGPSDEQTVWEQGPEVELKLDPKPTGSRQIYLRTDAEGVHRFRVVWRDATDSELSAEAFADLLYRDNVGRGWLFRLLNISSPVGIAWVLLGFGGQALFTGRMLVQWLTSERARRSVVPVAFWWMSLGGASMLIVYFVWRRDIVGVLGQATGWVIYVRNLWLIHREIQRPDPASASTSPSR